MLKIKIFVSYFIISFRHNNTWNYGGADPFLILPYRGSFPYVICNFWLWVHLYLYFLSYTDKQRNTSHAKVEGFHIPCNRFMYFLFLSKTNSCMNFFAYITSAMYILRPYLQWFQASAISDISGESGDFLSCLEPQGKTNILAALLTLWVGFLHGEAAPPG